MSIVSIDSSLMGIRQHVELADSTSSILKKKKIIETSHKGT